MKIIIDCEAIFLDGKCCYCDKTKPVANVWINAGVLYERKACKPCVNRNSHPADAALFRRLWYIQEQIEGKALALKELSELIHNNPKRKLFVALRELMQVKYPSTDVTKAIHEFWTGSLPSRCRQHAIATFIRGYRHVRNHVPRGKNLDHARIASEMYAVYRGTGSCGFF